MRQRSSTLIVEIVEDQRNGIRDVLVQSMAEGRNGRQVATDIVGTINKATGKREGGIIGLTSNQMKTTLRARAELENGDFDAYRNRKMRDRRFDRIINEAVKKGRPISAPDVNKMVQRYHDRLLNLRGETIGRTESHGAFHAAQYEALQQARDGGKLHDNQVRRVWHNAGDLRVRDSHIRMEGESVGLNEKFSNGLMYPGDQQAGSAAETVRCRCLCVSRIDFLANIGLPEPA